MRVHQVLFVSALMLGLAAPAAAQNEVAPVENQTASATVEKPHAPKPKVAAAGEKICKRMTNGKVCKTAEEWRQYEQMY